MWPLFFTYLGTTISPYLFFWQASQEVEEVNADPEAQSLRLVPQQARAHLHCIKIDTYIGMGISNLIALFIMLTTATTLFQHGITDIQTTEQAAQALRPIAGEFAFLLFSAGVVGTGMLAIPVPVQVQSVTATVASWRARPIASYDI